MKRKYLHVTTDNLQGFINPDTTSQKEGVLDQGYYLVLDEKLNFPNTETDYIEVLAPHLGDNNTWVCSRSKDNIYAELLEREIKSATPSFDLSNDEMAIPESALTDLLPHFYDFSYDFDRARYPYNIEGIKLPLAPPQTNNCCSFVEALVVKAWQNEHNIVWDSGLHGKMMILSSSDYFSPVTALVQVGIGEKIDSDDSPHPWSVIQGWRNQWRSGHTFIIVDHHEDSDRVLTLESNASYKLNGVGFRQIGNIKSVGGFPANWWENEELWTWEKLKSTYRYRKLAALKVKETTWV